MNTLTIRGLIDRPAWMADAACKGKTAVMYPVTNESTPRGRRDIDAARRICRSCDVQAECLAYALNTNEESGVWGGFSEAQRRPLKVRYAPAGRYTP